MTNQRICIIGGGPAGLSSAKALNAEPIKNTIDLYELKSTFGGVWHYFEDKHLFRTHAEIKKGKVKEYSPVYKYLETNIIPDLMAYADFPFECANEFPTHREVAQYLLDYSKTIGPIDNLYFNHKVTNVVKLGKQWEVTSQSNDGEKVKYYDVIICANGHFYQPYYPEIEGLAHWHTQDPYSLTHAKFFNDSRDYEGKTVVLVGGFTSGTDIALHLSSHAKKIYISLKKGAEVLFDLDKINPYIEIIPEINKVDYSSKTVYFDEGLVTTDSIIVCAGYLYDLPFLKNVTICKQHYIDELYKQIFWYKDPSLIFLGLGRNVNPLPMMELQASAIARVINGRIPLPSVEDMKADYEKDINESGPGKSFHNYKPPKDLQYTEYWQGLIKHYNVEDGLNSPVYEGRRLELRLGNLDVKKERVKNVSDKFLSKRNI